MVEVMQIQPRITTRLAARYLNSPSPDAKTGVGTTQDSKNARAMGFT